MKLKNIATLIFRIIGALLLVSGAFDILLVLIELLVAMFTHEHIKYLPISDGVGLLLLGYALIHYSKKWAALLCKGLDEES